MSFEELFSRRSYYLLVALTSEGQLIFEEDRDGSAYGVRLNDRNFLNGARHSVYYVRDNNTVTLLVGSLIAVWEASSALANWCH